MKIMMVTPYFYPKVGGLENYALNVAKQLKSQGHQVFIVTSNHNDKTQTEEIIKRIKVIRLPYQFKLSNTPISLKWKRQITKIINAEKPDVINAHTPVPFIADMTERSSGKVPFVLTYHNDLVKSSILGSILAKTYNFVFTRKTLRCSDLIIATSQHYVELSPYLKKWKNKISIATPGVDTTKFNLKVDKQWLKKKYSNKKTVLFVGSMQKTHAHKGVDVLIKSIAQSRKKIKNIQLVAVGSGDAIDTYKELAKKLNVSDAVDFPGFVSDNDLPKYFAGADVFVLPSTNESEGFGMVLAEAMACGTPVIGSRVGGIPFLVQDKQSLVDSKNVNMLSKAISRALSFSSSGKRAKMETLSRHIFDNFSWKQIALDYEASLKRAKFPKVCLIHNIVSPYRLPVWEEINNQVNLTVLFCKAITKDRIWTYDLNKYTFKYKILKAFSIGPIIFNISSLRELLRAQFDVVLVNSDPDVAPTVFVSILIAKMRRKKIVIWSLVTEEDIHFFPSIAYSNNFFHRILRKMLSQIIMVYRRFCFHLADQFIAFSNQAKIFLQRNDIMQNKISRTYQIMPPELLLKPVVNIKRNGYTFLYLGYLNDRKGINYLIDAFMNLKDQRARLLIAGSGPAEKKLRLQAENDLRIEFLGYAEGPRKADIYARADIFVLPTLLDVWGLVINEAIHYGLAVICSDAAEAKSIVNKNKGLIVRAADKKSLYDAMEYMITNQKTLRTMQENNFRDKSVVDVNKAANGYIKAIRASI